MDNLNVNTKDGLRLWSGEIEQWIQCANPVEVKR